jgi:hypothetical protein
MAFFTAGLLRQFHDSTPHSPYVPPAVGSLLFAGILFLLLVTLREHRRGVGPGPGVRLGSVTPIILMLLVEKWISLALYNPAFYWLAVPGSDSATLDAQFRAFAGVGLLAVCLLVARLSIPTARKTWRRVRPLRWIPAALAMTAVIGGTYLVLGFLSWGLGGSLRLQWPELSRLLVWVVCGQAVLALAEEVYYRGLLLSEMERVAPRLGVKHAAGRRWIALLSTSILFGMEHLAISTSFERMGRQLIFSISLGILFGLLVMVSANLHLVGGLHAWINWLLLGAAPIFVDAAGEAALPSGTYIGLALILAFILAFVIQRLRRRRRPRRAAA